MSARSLTIPGVGMSRPYAVLPKIVDSSTTSSSRGSVTIDHDTMTAMVDGGWWSMVDKKSRYHTSLEREIDDR